MAQEQTNIKKSFQELNLIQQQIQREKIRERKERTRRLIQKGALAEKYFQIENLTPDETELFFKKIIQKIKSSQ
ncbi:hypothetical protein PML80_09960 (plasmid) [Aerococcus urinaeequi]|uniref:DUF3847 domain-containing protein n=1 Tax=Aerococcus urinaeequi TaxID=51665 RepID=A0AAF0BJY3_9LACT|nr:hypothetical protein [Aerococcus urinaeequi]WCG38792.1 hypothetical protein PML80_09960 [Aerococcus urinaeequi]